MLVNTQISGIMHISTTNQPQKEVIMTKLIINTTGSTCRNAIITFIRAGFSVNAFAMRNGLLIAEVHKYQGMAVSKCNIDAIVQALYEIVAIADNNITAAVGRLAFAIDADGCHAVTASVVTLDDVYDETEPDRVIQDKAVRATMLAQYCAIVQAEDLAQDIALDIHFKGCKKQVYHVDYARYDATTLYNRLAQLGIKSSIVYNMHQLVIL